MKIASPAKLIVEFVTGVPAILMEILVAKMATPACGTLMIGAIVMDCVSGMLGTVLLQCAEMKFAKKGRTVAIVRKTVASATLVLDTPESMSAAKIPTRVNGEMMIGAIVNKHVNGMPKTVLM